MTNKPPGFFQRLKTAWQLAQTAPNESDLHSQLASLKMDLADRDDQMQRLRDEFGRERQQKETAISSSVSSEIEQFSKKLAPLLSQLETMRSLHEQGRDIKIEDLLKLLGKMEKVVLSSGLEPIGTVGERSRFDSHLHQRMSGGDVSDGDPVRVRFVGYRFKDNILTKAMVSREQR
jgi:molecular chaperone GrpE